MLLEAAVGFVLTVIQWVASIILNLRHGNIIWVIICAVGVFFFSFFCGRAQYTVRPTPGQLKVQTCEMLSNVFFDASSSRNLHNKMFEVSACVIMICNPLELMRKNLLVIFFFFS